MKSLVIISLLVAIVVADHPIFNFCDKDGSQYEYQIDLSNTYTVPDPVTKKVYV